MPSAAPELWPLYAQAIAFSAIMAGAHCPGMCGPLMVAFRLGGRPTEAAASPPSKRQRMASAAAGVGAYQSGRAVVYLVAGALVGWLGQSIAGTIASVGPWLLLTLAVGFLGAALWRAELAARWRAWRPATAPPAESRLHRITGKVLRRLRGRPALRAVALGGTMAFLPCHVPFVVMGLAAATASPLHGALLMLVVVVCSTPALMAAAALPHALGAKHGGRLSEAWVIPSLMMLSSAWLTLLALARLGVIPHLAIPLPDALAIPLPGGGALDHLPLF